MKAELVKKKKAKTRFIPWSVFDDSKGMHRSHLYKAKGLDNYVAKYREPNDYHVIDGEVKFIFDRLNIDVSDEPASVYEPQQLFDTLSNFGVKIDEESVRNTPSVQRAIRRAWKAFACDSGKLDALSTEASIKASIKLEKSGGIWFSNKEDSWDEAYKWHLDVINGKKWFKPNLAFYRTQRSNKTRLVWGSSTDVIITEGMFASQLMKRFSKHDIMSIGFKRYQLGALVSSITSRRRFSYALDFSKFDSTVPAFIIREAFKILRSHFNEFNEFESKAWDAVVKNFITGSIVMPDGFLYTGKVRGIPSGSWFTQLIGSICNYIIISAMTDAAGHVVYSENIMVLGDDSIFGLDVRLDLQQMAGLASKFGMNLNVQKSSIVPSHERVKYLGFFWERGRGYRDMDELFTAAVYPEKFRHKDEEMTPNERGLEMILNFLSLTHDGVNRAKESALNEVFSFDRERFKYTPMNIKKKGVSSLLNYQREYLYGQRENRVPYTFQMAKLY